MMGVIRAYDTGGSLSGEEANDLWESVRSRSDVRVENHSIIDESMVDNAAR